MAFGDAGVSAALRADDRPDDPDFSSPRVPIPYPGQGVPSMPAAPPPPAAAPAAPAAQEAYPSQGDIDRMISERSKGTNAVVDTIGRLSDERTKLLNTPTPRPPQPNYRDIPQAPKLQAQGFAAAAPGLIFSMIMGSKMSREKGMGALAAANGYMEGFQIGDKNRMDLERQNWKDQVEGVIKQNEVEHSRYEAVWNDTKLSQQDKQAKLQGIAASIGDQQTILALKNGDLDFAHKLMQDRQTATLKLQESQFKYGEHAAGMLDERALNAMVGQYLAGDRQAIANIGRGVQGSRNLANFRNALAAEMERRGMSGAEVAQKMAEFEGQKAGLRLLANREVNLGMASKELISFAGPALAASEAVPRGKFVPLNKLNQNLRALQSDPNLREFSNRNQGLIAAYAQIISRSGVSTVHAQKRAEELLNTAESPEAYQRAVDTLVQEAQIAESVPGQIRREFQERFTGKRPEAAAPAAPAAPKPAAGQRGGAIDLGDGITATPVQ